MFAGWPAANNGLWCWNGNPPALTRLRDGRLCCVFGDRANCRIVATYSADEGVSWGNDTVLRSDFQRDAFDDPDLGYPRVCQRADGQMIAIYYWATRDMPHRHIAATIWRVETDAAATEVHRGG